MADKMSEFDNDNAGATDDGKPDDTEMIEDEINTTMTAAEITGHSTIEDKDQILSRTIRCREEQLDIDSDK